MVTKKEDARPWDARLWHLVRESQDYIQRSGAFKNEAVKVTSVATLRDRNRRAVYSLRVRGGADLDTWVEELRDIVGRAHTVLDNAMWDAATRDGTVSYSAREEKQIYFPIAADSTEWSTFETKKHASALSAATRASLRAIQPFITGSDISLWLRTVNNTDKHRYPLNLSIRIDEQFVMLFHDIGHGKDGSGATDIDWIDPLPELRNREKLVEYRSENAIVAAPELDVPLTLCIQIGSEWVDLQDFLWDITEFVARAAGILRDGNTLLADYLKAHFDFEREQLAASRKMMIDGDPIAEMTWLAMSEQREQVLSEQAYEDSVEQKRKTSGKPRKR